MAGLPGTDALTDYGGPLNNYAPIVDASTDEDAGWRNLYAMNVAMMTHTACRAWCAFVAGSSPSDPVSNVHDSLWGNGVSVKPVVAHTGTGVWTITWLSSITDELGNSHAVNLRRCWAAVGGTTAYQVNVDVTSPNVVTVRAFTVGTSTPNDATGATITVFAV
jgi:hypothetical protein